MVTDLASTTTQAGFAVRFGHCSPEELGGIWLGAYSQFGHPVINQFNPFLGYQAARWTDCSVGFWRNRTRVDVSLLTDFRTGNVVFCVSGETQELADKWLKVTDGYADPIQPEDQARVLCELAQLIGQTSLFSEVLHLFNLR